MQVGIVLAAMRRNKVAVLLIVVQTAITLALVCNSLSIIRQRLSLISISSGIDEADTFVIDNLWLGKAPDAAAALQGDLASLRTLPGVIDAFASNAYPFGNAGTTEGVGLNPDDQKTISPAALYYVDDHALATLGLKLIAGRNFSRDEVADLGTPKGPSLVIITRELADRLFPQGNAVGHPIHTMMYEGRALVVGVVDQLVVPWASSSDPSTKTYKGSAILEPFRPTSQDTIYIVRVAPGRLQEVMRSAREQLVNLNKDRALQKIKGLSEARSEAYQDDRNLAIILGVVSVALLIITGSGIVGLTSYWVSERQRYIGIRRALGATRASIIRYFQIESLLIGIAGMILGSALSIVMNLWMVNRFEMKRLELVYILVGAAVVAALGQLATLWPASKAAAVSPSLSIRAI